MSVSEPRRAVTDGDILRCFPLYHELRPHLVEREIVERVRRQERRHGYEMVFLEEDGAPVPLLRISGRVLSSPQLQAHDRDRYARMIQGLISRMEARAELLRESWGANPLLAAAEAEREPITSPEDDDAY